MYIVHECLCEKQRYMYVHVHAHVLNTSCTHVKSEAGTKGKPTCTVYSVHVLPLSSIHVHVNVPSNVLLSVEYS